MPFYPIDDIKLNSRSSAFGGRIYGLSLDVGLTEKPTSITINFISESGEYLDVPITIKKPYRIQIGNILDDSFYAIRSKVVNTSQGRTLEVHFVDQSVYLDKLWVGLYKRAGDDTTNIPGLIIVGQEVPQCDVNGDNIFDARDAELLRWQGVDPCELRCPTDSSQTESLIEQCIEKEMYELNDIRYNLSDLVNALTGNVTFGSPVRPITFPIEGDEGGYNQVTVNLPGININKNLSSINRIKINRIPKNLHDFYYVNYTGTLRSVLSNICADLGWSFFFEKGALNFIDTKERPNINWKNYSNLEELSIEKTLEGTVSRGFISIYNKAGIKASNNCDQVRPFLLKCLNLKDLFGAYYKPDWRYQVIKQTEYASTSDSPNPIISDSTVSGEGTQLEYFDDVYPDGVDIGDFETACVCSFYSNTLRHLNTLWNYYGIKNAQLADSSEIKNKWLDRLGQMKILNVMSAFSEGDNLETYKREFGTDSTNEDNRLFSKEELAEINKYGGYLVAVLRKNPKAEQDLLDRQFRIEERLADEFMGQHWQRAYTAPFAGENPQISPDGKYFGALSTNAKEIPFAQFNHTQKSLVSTMVNSFAQKQKNNFRQYGRLAYSKDYQRNAIPKVVRSILYHQKSTQDKWIPAKNSSTEFYASIHELENYMFRKVETSMSPEKMRKFVTVNGQLVTDPSLNEDTLPFVELFVFFPQRGNILNNVTVEVVHNPNEDNKEFIEGLQPFSLSSVGLMSKECVLFNINGTKVYTPAAASVQFADEDRFRWKNRDTDLVEFDSPAFKVYVSNSLPNRGTISKFESVFVEEAGWGDTLKTEYQTKEINRDSIQFLNRLTDACTLPIEDIKAIHATFADNLNFSIEKPFETRSYRIYGVQLPAAIGIKEGLQSVNITASEEGIFTDIVIGDSFFTPPSPDFLLRALEVGIDPSKLRNKNPI